VEMILILGSVLFFIFKIWEKMFWFIKKWGEGKYLNYLIIERDVFISKVLDLFLIKRKRGYIVKSFAV
jgi:hypothetical protein